MEHRIAMQVCPVCKKDFIPAPDHRYKIYGGKLICSWNCLCEFRKGKKTYHSLGCKSERD